MNELVKIGLETKEGVKAIALEMDASKLEYILKVAKSCEKDYHDKKEFESVVRYKEIIILIERKIMLNKEMI